MFYASPVTSLIVLGAGLWAGRGEARRFRKTMLSAAFTCLFGFGCVSVLLPTVTPLFVCLLYTAFEVRSYFPTC